jgi:DtxR family transcriptional regulator, Mn-dependent transcriptional regulator
MPEHNTSSGHSESVENFLKTIYSLQQQTDRVSTNTLAEALTISAPSVTDMAQRMVKDGLVDYQKYRGVVLTAAGEAIALKVIRRHRLIELYLVRELGYELHEVHLEAENLEHAVSDHFIEAIARKLGNPDSDPHGDPIPSAELVMHERVMHSLADWPEDTPGVVSRLKTDSPDMLRHILDRGFKLEAQVEVTNRDPFEGPITAQVDGQERVIGHNVAECIMVEDADSTEHSPTDE